MKSNLTFILFVSIFICGKSFADGNGQGGNKEPQNMGFGVGGGGNSPAISHNDIKDFKFEAGESRTPRSTEKSFESKSDNINANKRGVEGS